MTKLVKLSAHQVVRVLGDDLAYLPDLAEKVFKFTPRDGVFTLQLPAYLPKAAEVFRLDADGTHDVKFSLGGRSDNAARSGEFGGHLRRFRPAGTPPRNADETCHAECVREIVRTRSHLKRFRFRHPSTLAPMKAESLTHRTSSADGLGGRMLHFGACETARCPKGEYGGCLAQSFRLKFSPGLPSDFEGRAMM